MRNLKVLVVGCGSIGRRHVKNLSELGVEDFVLCDKSEEALMKASEGLTRAYLTTSFAEAVAEGPEAAVVCTPSSMHLEMSRTLAEKGVHLLIEKPLSHNLDGVEELRTLAEEKGIVAMMAMCYRFHPIFLRLKYLLESGTIGRVYHVNYFGGHYLPDWHPKADYRKEYASQKALGGGVILTSIHGLDNIRWLFGEVVEGHSFVDRVSDLEMDVEDLGLGICRLENGVYVCWQTDFLQRAPAHRMIVAGSEGTIRCDFMEGTIEIFETQYGLWRTEEAAFDVNAMYLDEMRHFLGCVETGERPVADLDEGIRTLRLAMDVKSAGEMKGIARECAAT